MSVLLRQLCNKFNYLKLTNNIKKSTTSLFTVAKRYSNAPTPYEIINPEEDKLICEDIIRKLNDEKKNRLFAIVHVAGKQFKITVGDVIVIEGYWPPTCGDKINLEKVLMVGAANFTLIGRPLIQSNLVNIHATVIEKTISHSKVNFKKKRRKQYKRINFFRIPQTMLRINKIEVIGELNNPPEVNVKGRTLQ
ncbi:hypothetical protein RN001_002693 [Aquatica leii]|uniref:Large ribosomal subunit protein bL21m n=1 Tax=Aquatica leii TaxID=1421715 RepID=A0AAN7PH88_9COLE|nr:hypothetical protein RN001_002693 [Aquatica leii]